jgi:hypothetical protein
VPGQLSQSDRFIPVCIPNTISQIRILKAKISTVWAMLHIRIVWWGTNHALVGQDTPLLFMHGWLRCRHPQVLNSLPLLCQSFDNVEVLLLNAFGKGEWGTSQDQVDTKFFSILPASMLLHWVTGQQVLSRCWGKTRLSSRIEQGESTHDRMDSFLGV